VPRFSALSAKAYINGGKTETFKAAYEYALSFKFLLPSVFDNMIFRIQKMAGVVICFQVFITFGL